MNCEKVKEYLYRYLDGELEDDLRISIEGHIKECPLCDMLVKQEKKIDSIVKNHIPKEEAPYELREAVINELEKKKGWGGFPFDIPWLKPVLAPVFVVLLFVVVSLSAVFNSMLVFPVFAEAVSSHVQFLRGSYPMEIVSSDVGEVHDWFEGKMDFAVEIPQFANPDVKLVGGRICHLKDRKVAYVIFEKDGHNISAFLIDTRGMRIPKAKRMDGDEYTIYVKNSQGYRSVLCLKKGFRDTGCVFVSDMPEDEFMELII